MPEAGGEITHVDHLKVRILAWSKTGWLVWIYDFHYYSYPPCLFLCAVQSIMIQLSTYFCLATPMGIGLEDKDRSLIYFNYSLHIKQVSQLYSTYSYRDPQTSVFPQRCTTVSQVDRLILVLWGQGAVRSGMKGDVMKVSPKQHLCLR